MIFIILGVIAIAYVYVFLRVIRFSLGFRDVCRLAFLHPFAAAGGGGERVLWALIEKLSNSDSFLTRTEKTELDQAELAERKLDEAARAAQDSESAVAAVGGRRGDRPTIVDQPTTAIHTHDMTPPAEDKKKEDDGHDQKDKKLITTTTTTSSGLRRRGPNAVSSPPMNKSFPSSSLAKKKTKKSPNQKKLANGSPDDNRADIVIYIAHQLPSSSSSSSSSPISDVEILESVKERFGINLLPHLNRKFRFVRIRSWLLVKNWSFANIYLQAIGSVVMMFESCYRCMPDTLIDTTGYGFALPLAKWLCGVDEVGAYVHYPTITSDMIADVVDKTLQFNNGRAFSKSEFLAMAKKLYYDCLLFWYQIALKRIEHLVVNSSWTQAHINEAFNEPWKEQVKARDAEIKRKKEVEALARVDGDSSSGEARRRLLSDAKLMFESVSKSLLSTVVPKAWMPESCAFEAISDDDRAAVIADEETKKAESDRQTAVEVYGGDENLGRGNDMIIASTNEIKVFPPNFVRVVYPPCDFGGCKRHTSAAAGRRRDEDDGGTPRRKNWILSCSQFRPEKDQIRQVLILKKLAEDFGDVLPSDFKFIMAGSTTSCGQSDQVISDLRTAISEHKLNEHIELRTNLQHDELVSLLKKCKVALHTMRNEHFGISVVEMMASGAVVVAHNSGGPRMDILKPLDDNELKEVDWSLKHNATFTKPPPTTKGAAADENDDSVGEQRNESQNEKGDWGGDDGQQWDNDASTTSSRPTITGFLMLEDTQFCHAIATALGGFHEDPRIAAVLENAEIRLRRMNNNDRFATCCLEALGITLK